jgi:hypothetical protein
MVAMTEAEQDIDCRAAFIEQLDALGVALFTAQPGGRIDVVPNGNGELVEEILRQPDDPEFIRPMGWTGLTAEGNDDRIGEFRYYMALCVLCGLVLAVFDVDPRNGGDIEKVRALLARLKVRIFAEVDTPGGGKHFYIAGHEELPTVHSTAENQKLPDYPGVDIQSHGANTFLPGTLREKYGWRGYTIVFDDLDKLAADAGTTQGLADWVAEQLAVGVKTRAKTPGAAREWEWDSCEPWDGPPPDRRQQAYLDAAVKGEAAKVAKTTKGGRNIAIFTAALKMGHYIAGAGLDEQVVISALEEAAEANGVTAEDGLMATRASIRSGLRCGKKTPRAVPEEKPNDIRRRAQVRIGRFGNGAPVPTNEGQP